MNNKLAGEKFAELLDIMARLRGENGCPWDKEQTHDSLRPFLLEESHELLDALAGSEAGKIREELGDLLHQIVFHCQIAVENGTFTADRVIIGLIDKMVRRHPHVFSDHPLPNSAAVTKQWAQIKAQETDGIAEKSALGNLPKSMPALARAQTIIERASNVGFNWLSAEPMWQKIEEELIELRAACAAGDKRRTEDELGDVFFSLVNLGHFLGVRAEDALVKMIHKFIKRFNYIESSLRAAGKSPATSSLEEMDRLWDEQLS
ncbi:MAG: nucleoside triphosphate pyrophosphohydrolase [Candidatus Binatia bacterium]